jgi:glutathione S-transferase
MGEVPVLACAGEYRSQSGAILTWLAETTGKFAPAAEARYEALRWMLFDNHRFTGTYAPHRILTAFAPEAPHPALMAWLRPRVESAFALVDTHLRARPFMLGDAPTIVDFSLAGYVFYPPEETGFDLRTAFPAIGAWRDRLAGLPGWKPPYELMAVGSSLPLRAR